jgi:hypothetical protein
MHEYLQLYKDGYMATVKSSNFVRGSKFRHPNSDFLEPPASFISQDIQIFQKHILFEIFFSFDLFLCKKGVNMTFFKDLYFVRFCEEILKLKKIS